MQPQVGTTGTAAKPGQHRHLQEAGGGPGPPPLTPSGSYRRTVRRRSELAMTETELSAIASAATIGLSRMPRNG